jgi:transcriptional regulator with XRE-family HTH domain
MEESEQNGKSVTLRRELAKALRVGRASKDMTQAALAAHAGTSPNTVNEIEGGKGNPTLDTIDRIAGVLGLEVSIRVAA